MQFCNLFGAAAACALLGLAPAAQGTLIPAESADCTSAKADAAKAQLALSEATRSADTKAAAYTGCVEAKGAAACAREKSELDKALRKKRDAKAAYRYAAAKQKQACGQ